ARCGALFGPEAPREPAATPAVTLLKPLHRDEPGLEAALASIFDQDYPGRVQVVFGLQDPADLAGAVVERLRSLYPDWDVAIVVDPRLHGSNRKVSNLINMSAAARHELLVLADSDITAPRDHLRGVAASLARPGVGVVTCAYYGLPQAGLWSRL